MKTYTIEWVDLVSRELKVKANSPEEALAKFNDEDLSGSEYVQESDIEYHQDPSAAGED